eukprot:maker-scaffold1048_size67263-snap-gene-0.20 protein:Tk10017 transcript:maker-scaffold1048_size67263-snap-gene-0.20-mRNA-1 annotation:"hypothetical protein LOTGIDRAFT_118839"
MTTVKMEEKPHLEEKRYVQLPPETVRILAQSSGFEDINPSIARALSEDVSYRTRELAHVCGQFMRHSKRKQLTSEDVNRALHWYNVQPVYGYESSASPTHNYHFVEEAEVFVEDDEHVSLQHLAINEQPLHLGPEPTVTASWIAIEGVPLLDDEVSSRGVEYPQASHLSGPLKQYYQATTTAILGTSEQILKTLIDDIATNPKISPLLPFFISFIRTGIQKHGDDQVFTARILDLIQALFNNPYLNFSPKPYLSHLVTALLSCLITDRKSTRDIHRQNGRLGDLESRVEIAQLEHVPKASRILGHVLDKWATPVNQLGVQTHKALRDSLLELKTSLSSQYGALHALLTIAKGSQPPDPVLGLYMKRLQPRLSETARPLGLDMEDQIRVTLLSKLCGLVQHYGRSWLSQQSQVEPGLPSDYSVSTTYLELYEFCGDSISMISPVSLGPAHIPEPELLGKLRVRRLPQANGHRGGARQVSMSSRPAFPTSGVQESNVSSFQGSDFEFLAGCEVPADIFENDPTEPSSTTLNPSDGSSGQKISAKAQAAFDVIGDDLVLKAPIILNFGRPTPQHQLKSRASTKLTRPQTWTGFSLCSGRRLHFPRTTNRYRAQRLFSCGLHVAL